MEAIGSRKLVIGLGNPGAAYAHTYHNVGALALLAIAAELVTKDTARWETHKKLFAYARSGELILVRPLTFMNVSGLAIREAARKFNVSPQNIILLHDDSDLTLGSWKISRRSGAAGHHGVESAVATLGGNDFTRIRIGIRPEKERMRKKAEDFVLKPITKTSGAILAKTFKEIAGGLKKWTE